VGVVALTAAMMLVEIIGGSLFGSIALVADGWHMATHVIALAIAGFAYLFARRHARDARFSLGTGKFGELAAFASAIILGLIALGVGYESVLRLFHPVVIHFAEAVPIAGLGLCVNLASARLLRVHHDHDGDHVHPGSSHHHADRAHPGLPHRDTNFRAAYVHVLADAVTSVGAIAGLSSAWAFGWSFMDPLVGLLGTIVMVTWGLSLIRSAGSVLLDAVPDPALAQIIRQRIETNGDQVTDLHGWQLGPGHAAVMVSAVSNFPQAPAARLEGLAGLSHVTIEVNACGNAQNGERRVANAE
jgi:cation diffusion facilitator family transporter